MTETPHNVRGAPVFAMSEFALRHIQVYTPCHKCKRLLPYELTADSALAPLGPERQQYLGSITDFCLARKTYSLLHLTDGERGIMGTGRLCGPVP